MKKINKSIEIDGQEMKFEFSDLVEQANGSVIVSQGDTKVLVTAVMGGETDKNYLPLKVDYEERYYAKGEILGGKYNKREGRPSIEATLSARVIDRSIRPFFDENLSRDVHVVATVLSLGEFDPDILALNGASIALMISDIPWNGPVGAVRIAKANSQKIQINPSYKFRETDNYLETVFSGKGDDTIAMIEIEASEVSEKDFLEIFDVALNEISNLTAFFNQIQQELGKDSTLLTATKDKEKTVEELEKEQEEKKRKTELRQNILEKEERLDGRKLDEIRKIEVNAERISNIVHGTGIFYRGETHVMSVLTLGHLEDALFIEGMEIQGQKKYLHHYNFPPYSVGEVGRMGSPKRREIGHGRLAEKALKRMLPKEEDFPYTMRVVSEVMSSNGSTSMASTCASTLALLSGGVPIKKPVAGIAIGLITENGNLSTSKILTDIQGVEDHFGDMDFKVTGTEDGITAMQLDIKIAGINREIVEQALERAKKARLEILAEMKTIISEPAEMSEQVERIGTLEIPKDKIGRVIGTGGATIKRITKESGAKIDIKRDGHTFIYGSKEAIEKTKNTIQKYL